jgi:hypothetical protein
MRRTDCIGNPRKKMLIKRLVSVSLVTALSGILVASKAHAVSFPLINLQDVLTLQDELASDIADEIRVKLTTEERTRLTAARPVNPKAHDA